jgi:hypothetical protein
MREIMNIRATPEILKAVKKIDKKDMIEIKEFYKKIESLNYSQILSMPNIAFETLPDHFPKIGDVYSYKGKSLIIFFVLDELVVTILLVDYIENF